MFNFKKRKRDKQLLKEFEEGKILQVNNKINNKEYFESKENAGPKPTE